MSNFALHPSERADRRAARRAYERRQWRKAALIAAPIVAGIALSTPIALSVLPMPAAATRLRLALMPAAPASAAAPSAAEATFASPGSGVTGTTALPPEPRSFARAFPSAAAPGVSPALPFSMRGVSGVDRGRALNCLTDAIYYEAASESDDGQRAVAQVVLNRVRHPAFPATVCGVIYQGSEKGSGCQFSYACDGSMARLPSPAARARAGRIAAAALAGYVFRPVGLATHYHTYAVTPAWNRTLVMTDAIGAHFFHRWKGYWGTSAAFQQRYLGHEPAPGPAPRALPGMLPVVAPAPAFPVAPPPVTATAPVASAREDQGAVDVLAQSQVLDRWKDSGKPLK